jgi:hypothetical protein
MPKLRERSDLQLMDDEMIQMRRRRWCIYSKNGGEWRVEMVACVFDPREEKRRKEEAPHGGEEEPPVAGHQGGGAAGHGGGKGGGHP